ncbi:uncharacterized protein LOC129316034 isoform X1 [Prosopis cineraria]|uniref:uncharacterized protein LOC129316034 isoform X1 n=1 Tax=Prosopis cineraria TaxID=364024 RepID=UPI00240F1AAC|nr:uncharacterized protein LOC129316034 isoform X1 [Prosopis cineraria]
MNLVKQWKLLTRKLSISVAILSPYSPLQMLHNVLRHLILTLVVIPFVVVLVHKVKDLMVVAFADVLIVEVLVIIVLIVISAITLVMMLQIVITDMITLINLHLVMVVAPRVLLLALLQIRLSMWVVGQITMSFLMLTNL